MKYSEDRTSLQKSTVYSSIDELKKRVEELSLAKRGSLRLWFSPKEWSFEGTTLYLDKLAPESISPIPQDSAVLFQLLFGLYVANTTFGISPKDVNKFIVTQEKPHDMTFALEVKVYVDIFEFETPYHVTLDYQDFETNTDLNLSGVADTFKPLLNESNDGKLLLAQLLQPAQDYGSGIPWGLNLALFHPFFKDYYKGESKIDYDDTIFFESGHRRMWTKIEKDNYRNALTKSLKEIRKDIDITFQENRASKYPLDVFEPVVVELLTLWDKTKEASLTYEDAVKGLKDTYTLFRKIYKEDKVEGLGYLNRFTAERDVLLKSDDFDPKPSTAALTGKIGPRTKGYISVLFSIIGLISGKNYQNMQPVAKDLESITGLFDDTSYPSIQSIHNSFLAHFKDAKAIRDEEDDGAKREREKKEAKRVVKEEEKRKAKEAKEALRKAKEAKDKRDEEAREALRKAKETKKEDIPDWKKKRVQVVDSDTEDEDDKDAKEAERLAEEEEKRKAKEAEKEAERVAKEEAEKKKGPTYSEKEDKRAQKVMLDEFKKKEKKVQVESDTEEEEDQGPKKAPPKKETFGQNDEKVKDKRTLDEVVGVFKRIRDQFIRQKYTGGVTDSVVEAYAIEFHKFAEIVNANEDLKAKLRDLYNPDAPNPLPAWVSISGHSYYPKETFISSKKIIQAPGAKLAKKVLEGGYGVDMIEKGKKWGSTLLHERVIEHLFLIYGVITILFGFKMLNPIEYRNLNSKLTGKGGGYLKTKGLETTFLTYFNDVFVLPPAYDTGEVTLIRQTLEIIETNSRYFDQVKQEYNAPLIQSELINPLKKRFEQFESTDFGSLNETLEQLGLLVGKEPIQLHQFVETKDAKTALQTKLFHAVSLAEHVVDALENGQTLDEEIVERLESEWPVEYFRKRPGQVINI